MKFVKIAPNQDIRTTQLTPAKIEPDSRGHLLISPKSDKQAKDFDGAALVVQLTTKTKS